MNTLRPVKLCLHAGGHEVTASALDSLLTPAATETHFPIAHNDLVARVRAGLNNANLEIVSEAHAIAHEGNRYFGLFQIGLPGRTVEDYAFVMGLRNSHDKSFPAGITVGSQVFVCDNLAFSGDIKLARKHTRFIFRDLPGKVNQAIGMLSDAWISQDTRFQAYKEFSLDDRRDVSDILIRALENGAITKTQITDVLAEWNTPSHEEFSARNVWSLYNAFTEKFKGNLDLLHSRSVKLRVVLDGYCGLELADGLETDV